MSSGRWNVVLRDPHSFVRCRGASRPVILGAVVAVLVVAVILRFTLFGGSDEVQRGSYEYWQGDEQIDALIDADPDERLAQLREMEPAQAREALRIMAERGTPESRAALEDLMDRSDQSFVRGLAAEMLGTLEDPPVDRLEATAAGDDDSDARHGAMRGLMRNAETGETDMLPTFVAGLRDPDAGVRKVAIEGIARISGKRFLYDPKQSPGSQAERIAFIERRLREMNLLR